jgi:hypothetical protein
MGSRRNMAGRTSASSVEPLQIDANKNPDPDASAFARDVRSFPFAVQVDQRACDCDTIG